MKPFANIKRDIIARLPRVYTGTMPPDPKGPKVDIDTQLLREYERRQHSVFLRLASYLISTIQVSTTY